MGCGIGCVEKLTGLSDRCALCRHGSSFGYKVQSVVGYFMIVDFISSKLVKEKGMGSASIRVKVRNNLVSGATISASSLISFDFFENDSPVLLIERVIEWTDSYLEHRVRNFRSGQVVDAALLFKEHGIKSDGTNGSREGEERVLLQRSGMGTKLDQERESDGSPG